MFYLFFIKQTIAAPVRNTTAQQKPQASIISIMVSPMPPRNLWPNSLSMSSESVT